MNNQQRSMRHMLSSTNNNQFHCLGRGQTARASTRRGRGRGCSGGRGRGRGSIFSSANCGVIINNKWVRAPRQDFGNLDGTKDADGTTHMQCIEVATSPARLASSNVLEEAEDPVLERRGAHKLVTKRVRAASAPKVERPLKNYIDGDERDQIADYATAKEFEASISRSWKRQSPRLQKHYGREDNIDTNLMNSNHHTSAVGSSSRRPRRICVSKKLPLHIGERYRDDSGNEQSNVTDGGNGIDIIINDHPNSDLQPQKTLTDFCYQDTGWGRDRGGIRGRGNRGRGHTFTRDGRASRGKNMGLVRIKPNDLSSTPICPTFSRGLQCNNVKCTRRHDVSTEASRPICVFFQRNGMCSKGDECPFRHVKVRWDAEICPTFSRVGYCEVPNCLLRHAVTKRPRIDGLV